MELIWIINMDDIKNFIDNLGIAAFEANLQLAGLAVVSDSGDLIFQTENWDLSKETEKILNVIRGSDSIVINGANFSVVSTSSNGIVASNEGGMGHVLFAPFQGGVLVSYAMARADTFIALSFLKRNAMRLNGKF
jgi:hypothetical protein